MNVMLLALFFSDAALNASNALEYELVAEPGERRMETSPRTHAWNPHIQSRPMRRAECPAFFQSEIEGFGLFRVGSNCDEEEVPYAL